MLQNDTASTPQFGIIPPDPDSLLNVLEGVELRGRINTADDQIVENIKSSIRRGHPQVWAQAPKGERVVLVGGGPSLQSTEKELIKLIHEGALLVTLNGAYHWCLERNLKPNAQIVLDARESNVRFVQPEVPKCRYYIASQCHPSTWDAVEGREFVGIYHAVDPEGVLKDILNDYYMKAWQGCSGGTTVCSRALGLLRMMGYLRFDLFGIDSCWMDEIHHAYPQPENLTDKRLVINVSPTGNPTNIKQFVVSPWHIKQLEDFLQFIRINGDQFLLNIHGNGLIAHAITESADISITEQGVL